MTAAPEAPGEAGPASDRELHAYVDGLLAPERRATVEARLEADPEARERVAAWRQQNAVIAAMVGEAVDEEPLPWRLHPAWLARQRRRKLRQLAAAAALALVAGLGVGWLARAPVPQLADPAREAAIREGTLAHAAAATLAGAPAAPVASDPEALAAHLTSWLDLPLATPDLASFGLRLVDAQPLLTAAGDRAALLAYEGGTADRLTLYMSRPTQPVRSQARKVGRDGAWALYWPYEELHCVLVGRMAPDRLRAMAQVIDQQIEAEEGHER